MNIAFSVVKNINRGGGIEKYTLELGSRLVSRGHSVTVFSMGHYGEVPSEVAGMRIVDTPSMAGRFFEKLSTGACAAVKALSLPPHTIIHFHSVGAGSMAFMDRLVGHPCVLQMHGIEWQRSRWNAFGVGVLKALEALSVRQTHRCTAVSHVQCEYLGHRYGVDCAYIPTGAEIKPPAEAREILGWGLRPRRYVLFASRLVREKGAQYLIPAFRKLATDHHLVIAGDAQGEELYKKQLRALAGDDPRIIFPGFVEGRALDELFSNASVYVQPSELEGLSIALLEAMSYGCSCLTSDIPENREALGDCGRTFVSGNVESLSCALGEMLFESRSLVEVGERARERVRAEYSWDSIANAFEKLYSSL